MAAALDKARVSKDAIAVDLMTNMVPQHRSHNSGMWQRLERDLRDLVEDTNHNRNLYVITGNSGTLGRITRPADFPGLNVNIPASVWKIVLVSERLIENVADIENDPTALALAVYSPNDNSVLRTNWRRDQNSNYLYSVREVEQNTNYNFFSNLSSGTQDRLENRTRNNVWQDVNALFASLPSSPLLAEINEVSSSFDLETDNISIWHSGTANDVSFTRDKISGPQEIGIGEIRSTNTTFENSILQTGFHKIGSTATTSTHITAGEISPVKQSSIETGNTQHGVTQVGFSKIGSDEIAAIKHGFMEISSDQIGSSKVSSIHINFTQIGISQNSFDETGARQSSIRQIDTSKFSLDQIASPKSNSTEIPLTSSISLQQFLGSHNYTSQNTTVPTWLSFLTNTTPFNLTLDIRDLPTGQLAEAQLTGFDANGKPNAGTLLLDYNGNDLGWF
jgi:hypothetical protein